MFFMVNIMKLFLHRNVSLLSEHLIFEQKGKFLQSTTVCFGEEKVDKHDFEGQDATIRKKPLPFDGFDANRVNKSGEEPSATAEELVDG